MIILVLASFIAVGFSGCGAQIRTLGSGKKGLLTLNSFLSITGTNPSSPSNVSATPLVLGSVTGVIQEIRFYDNPLCAGGIGSGSSADLNSTGLPIHVATNAATSIYAVGFSGTGATLTDCALVGRYTHDTNPPTLAFSAPASGFAMGTSSTMATISGSCTENGRTVQFGGAIAGSTMCANGAFSTAYDFSGISDGALTVTAVQTDAAGNPGVASVSLTKDTAPPTGASITIAGGAAYTATTAVSLALSATDAAEMYVTNVAGCGSGGAWESYATSKAWTLGQTNGTATVYVKFRDSAGNETGCSNAAIIHDDVAPTLAFTTPGSPLNAGNAAAFALSGICSENGRNVAITGAVSAVVTCAAGAWSTVVDLSGVADGNVSLAFDHSDSAGNAATPVNASIAKDATVPATAITAPNGGETLVAGDSVAITWTASDAHLNGGSAVYLAYSYDGTTWVTISTSAVASDGTAAWTVPSGSHATVKVRVCANDTFGNNGCDASDANFAIQPPVTAATSLAWVQSSPASTLALTAQWTNSASASLSDVKIQFYADGACGTASGGLIDLLSNSTQSRAWTAPGLGTYSFKVSSFDSLGNSAASACSDAIVVEQYFYQGIAVGGDTTARTIGGNAWITGADAVAAGMTFPLTRQPWSSASMTLSPAADADTSAMLNNGTWRDAADLSIAYPIPNGSYQIYVWEAESYRDYFRLYDLELEGERVARNLGYLPYAHWERTGPYAITVADGSLDLLLSLQGMGDAIISGLEIYRTSPVAATRLVVTEDAPTDHFERECSAITVRRTDASGTPANPASALAVNLNATLGGFYSDSECGTPATSATIAANRSGTGVYYKTTTAGTATLTASASGLTDGTLAWTTSGDLFRDDFSDSRIDLKWQPWSGDVFPVEQSDRLELSPAANTAWSWSGVFSALKYDLRDASLIFEVSAVLTTNVHTYNDFYACDATDCFTAEIWNGMLDFKLSSGSVDYGNMAYDATAMRYLRMRFDSTGGSVYLETSPDGATWTTQRTAPASTLDLSRLNIEVGVGTDGTGVASPGTARIERIYATKNP